MINENPVGRAGIAWKFAMLACAALLAACGGDGAVTQPQAPSEPPTLPVSEVDPKFSVLQLQAMTSTRRVDCPMYESLDFKKLAPECWQSDVPENYDVAGGARLSLLSFVWRTTAEQPKGTIYLLDGGPGGSGLDYIRSRVFKPLQADGWDVVIPAHRGTQSSALACPRAEEAMTFVLEPSNACKADGRESAECQRQRQLSNACMQEIVDQKGGGEAGRIALSQYHTVNAARDVVASQAVIARTKRSVLYGASYGTYWAMRIAQLHPLAFNDVILDSSLPLTADPASMDLFREADLEKIIDACFAHESCGQRFGGGLKTGAEVVATALASFNTKDCVPADVHSVSRQDPHGKAYSHWIRSGMPELLTGSMTPDAWPMIPYFMKAAIDCNRTELAAVLERAGNNPDESREVPLAERSLNDHLYPPVVFNEITNASSAVVRSAWDRIIELVSNRALGGNAVAALFWELIGPNDWHDFQFNGVVKSYRPMAARMLVMSAQVDTATPLGATMKMLEEMHQVGINPEQYIARHASHTVAFNSYPDAETGDPCGFRRVLHFINGKPQSEFSCGDGEIDWDYAGEAAASSCMLVQRPNPWSPADPEQDALRCKALLNPEEPAPMVAPKSMRRGLRKLSLRTSLH